MSAITKTTVPTTSRQVVFTSIGTMETAVQTVPVPGPDDLVIRVARVGICATDLHLLAGHIGDPFPLVPGHEFVGEVAAIGADAALTRRLEPGDRVAVEMLLPCRACPRCREGRYNLCDADNMALGLDRGRQLGVNIPRSVAPGLWGGYAEYVYLTGDAIVHPLPESLPWDRAVLVEPLAVAHRAIHRARLRAGESVVVIGPGPVGILVAAAARAAGAGSVIVVGTRPERLALAARCGADVTVDVHTADAIEVVHAELGGLADVVVEAAGVPAAQQQAVHLVRRGGRVVLAGACGADVPLRLLADEDLLTREIDLLPSFLSAGGFEPAIRLLDRGDMPFEDLVTHHFGLDDVASAFALIDRRDDDVLKVVIDPTTGGAT